MEHQQVSENKMGYMPINRLLLSMSIPVMISMLVQALYNIVDSVFVARISENALTAVSLVFPIQNLMISVATGTAVGVNALVSRRLGQKKFQEANETANNAILLALLSYVVFMLIGVFGSGSFLLAQTDILEIVEAGTQYMTIVLAAGFGVFGQICLERLLQATGRMMYTMVTQMAGAVINIIFDPLLIFGIGPFPELGVRGAAIATVMGQIIAMILALIFNVKCNPEIQLRFSLMKPKKDIIKDIYVIGIPSILMMSIGSLMTFCTNKILMGFTATATAVFGAYFKLQSFAFMPLFGMNQGVIPIVGYNLGAGKKDRIREVWKMGMIYAYVIMLICLALMQIIPDRLLMWFDASEQMLAIGVPAFRIISLCFLSAGGCVIGSSVFQGTGRSIYSLIVSACRQLVVLLPVELLLAKVTGELNMVWWAFPIAEVLGLIITIILLVKLFKNLDQMMKKLN